MPVQRIVGRIQVEDEATQLMGVEVAWVSAMGIGTALAGLAGGLLVTIACVNAGIGTAISPRRHSRS